MKSAMGVRWRIGTVSFLNSCPLNYGLRDDPQISLMADVPSRLLDHLRDGDVDVALLPVIDYQRLEGLVIVPVGGIGSDGPTLTVRIFSPVPIEQIRSLACDTDSHTSVALAQIVLAERFGVRPRLVGLPDATRSDDQALLLIGDKVVSDEPPGYTHQYDLGEQWKLLTGLPFVFAVWMARAGVELGDLPQRLAQSRQAGLANIERIIREEAVPRRWPADVARRYLTVHLQYDIGPRQLDAIRRFHALSSRHGLIGDPRPLVVCDLHADSARPKTQPASSGCAG